MTAILAALSAAGVLKWIGIAFVAIAGVAGAWFRGKSAGATQATSAAQDKIDAATSEVLTAKQQTASAQADAQSAKETTAAVRVAADARAAAQAIPDADLDAAGAKLGALRSD